MQNVSEITLQERIELVERWQKSGKTVIQFCKEENISCHAFHYWRKKWNPTIVKGFVKLKQSTAVTVSDYCEMIFTNGTRLLFHQQPQRDFVNQLLG